MLEEFEYHFVLRHSSRDKAVMPRLAERLKVVWFENCVINPGDSILAKIEERLEHSRVLLLCLSAQAFGAYCVLFEAGTFRRRHSSFRGRLNRVPASCPIGSAMLRSITPWPTSYTLNL